MLYTGIDVSLVVIMERFFEVNTHRCHSTFDSVRLKVPNKNFPLRSEAKQSSSSSSLGNQSELSWASRSNKSRSSLTLWSSPVWQTIIPSSPTISNFVLQNVKILCICFHIRSFNKLFSWERFIYLWDSFRKDILSVSTFSNTELFSYFRCRPGTHSSTCLALLTGAIRHSTISELIFVGVAGGVQFWDFSRWRFKKKIVWLFSMKDLRSYKYM